MSVMFLLIVLSIVFAGGFLGAFFWAVKSGQFDDKYTPSMRILLDETTNPEEKDENNHTSTTPLNNTSNQKNGGPLDGRRNV